MPAKTLKNVTDYAITSEIFGYSTFTYLLLIPKEK